MGNIEPGGARLILMTDGEELEATQAIVRMVRAGLGWRLLDLARACAAVGAPEFGWGGPSVEMLRLFEAGSALDPRAWAVLEETLSRLCWVTVVRGEVGVCLKPSALRASKLSSAIAVRGWGVTPRETDRHSPEQAVSLVADEVRAIVENWRDKAVAVWGADAAEGSDD